MRLIPLLAFIPAIALANPEVQKGIENGPIGHVAIIKEGREKDFGNAIAKLGAVDGLATLNFRTEVIDGKRIVLASYHGDPAAWSSASAVKALEPFLLPHPRLGADAKQPWVRCETVNRIRPSHAVKKPGTKSSWHFAVTGLKPEMEREYRQMHDHVWPGVIEAIGNSNIAEFDIFLVEFGDNVPYLFYQFEYVGSDFEADMKSQSNSPVNLRWWKFTDACQQPLPSAAKAKKIWEDMETVGTGE
ncbi:MAG: L-rhamnose mutarotase [Verrucomicrobiota bacterium]